MPHGWTGLFLALACTVGCGAKPEELGPLPGLAADGSTVAPDAGSTQEHPDGGPWIRRIVSLEVTPPSLQLKVGNTSGLSAVATFDDGSSDDLSGSVTWNSSGPAVDVSILSASGNSVQVEALAAGFADVTASAGAVHSSPCRVTAVPLQTTDAGTALAEPEVRAVWVTRFAYQSSDDVKGIINRAGAAGFNVVYFQIRGNGDAFYRSSLVPWAEKLTGTLGKDPGWDPLQTAIDAAHARGMELHAYWNVFSGWPAPAGCASTGTCTCQAAQGHNDSCQLPPSSPLGQPTHLFRAHPEYLAVNSAKKSADSEYYWFSPGNAAVRDHLVAAMTELVTRYAVDGVHLDRVRYEGLDYSHDAASEAAFAAQVAPALSWPNWQRANVTDVVARIYAAMKAKRPKAVLSASVWGIYKALPGCSTSQGYFDYFQDSQGWIKAGKIDALTPMIYWGIGTGCTDWAKLLDGFLAAANGRHIVAGMHAHDSSLVQPEKIKSRIAYARTVGAAGTSIFASTYLEPALPGGGGSGWSLFRAPGGPYLLDAGTPEMPWR